MSRSGPSITEPTAQLLAQVARAGERGATVTRFVAPGADAANKRARQKAVKRARELLHRGLVHRVAHGRYGITAVGLAAIAFMDAVQQHQRRQEQQL